MNLGAPELIIIVVFVLLLFGYKRLPDAARSLGRSARILKAEVAEVAEVTGDKRDDWLDPKPR